MILESDLCLSDTNRKLPNSLVWFINKQHTEAGYRNDKNQNEN